MSKLLHRTRRPFWTYATVVLLLSVPAYYLILDRVWLADIDQDLEVQKRKVEQGLNARKLPDAELAETIAHLNALDVGVQLTLAERDSLITDRYHTVVRHDEFHGHDEPFRTYESTIRINGRKYAITVERVIEETEELVAAIALVALVSLLLLFGGVLLLDRIHARRLWAPFRRILEALKRFKVDGPAAFQAAPTGITEFDELEHELERLTRRNMAIYAEQRRFTENAAHELRTPIALLQGKLERLFQTDGLTQEQAELLEQANAVLSRMHRLHEGLLLLARLDNAPVPEQAHCDPAAIVKVQLEHAAERMAALGLSVTTEAEGTVTWPMDAAMAEILLGNLIGNAIRYNVPGGSIHIRITPTSLAITNTGAAQALDPDHVFKRFSGSDKGLGLGLAIAQRVCERHGWSLTYAFIDGKHTFRAQADRVGL